MHQTHKSDAPAALSPRQALELLGQGVISRASFYAALSRGDIPSRRLGKRFIIPRHAFMRWLEGSDVQDVR